MKNNSSNDSNIVIYSNRNTDDNDNDDNNHHLDSSNLVVWKIRIIFPYVGNDISSVTKSAQSSSGLIEIVMIVATGDQPTIPSSNRRWQSKISDL